MYLRLHFDGVEEIDVGHLLNCSITAYFDSRPVNLPIT